MSVELPNFEEDLSQDDLKVFLEEAEEQLQLLDEEVIRLEKESTEEGLATIFRAAHTLKGSSAMIGYRAMMEVAHAMESMLDKLRNGIIFVTPGQRRDASDNVVDLNGDGVVNAADLSLAISNIGLSSPTAW